MNSGPRYRPVLGPSPDLTPREVEVIALLAGGLPDKEIARRLTIAHNTVRNHVRHIYARLRVHSRMEAAIAWHQITGRISREIPGDPPVEMTVTVHHGGLIWHGSLSPWSFPDP